MAQFLTWRDVAAPDFRGSMAGVGQAAQLINAATDNLGSGLAAFDKAQTAGANQQALLESLRFTNPEDYQRALASGAVTKGIDPSRLSTDTLNTLSGRVNTLMNQNAAADKQTQDRYNFDRTVEGNQAADASRGAINALYSAASGRDLSAIAGLSPAQQAQAASNAGSMDASRINNRNDTEQREAQKLIQDFQRSAGGVDDVRVFLDRIPNPNIRARVQAAAEGQWGPVFGPKAGVDPLTQPIDLETVDFSSDPNSYNYGYGDKMGAPAVALGNMTMGQKMTHGLGQIAATKGTLQGTDKGTSAAGKYQITNTTLEEVGPKLFGANWREQPFNADTQEKVGQELYSRRIKGKSDMTSEWTGLKRIQGAGDAGAWDGIPWNVARDVISQYESHGPKVLGSNPSMADVRAYAKSAGSQQADQLFSAAGAKQMNEALQFDASSRKQEQDPSGIYASVAKNIGSSASVKEVTDQLLGKDGRLSGADPGKVLDQVRKVAKDYGISPANAGEIISRSVDSIGAWPSWTQPGTTKLGDDLQFIDSDLETYANQAKDKSQVSNAVANLKIDSQVAQLQAAQEKVAAAEALFTQARNLAETNAGYRNRLPQAKRNVNEARKAYSILANAVSTELKKKPEVLQKK